MTSSTEPHLSDHMCRRHTERYGNSCCHSGQILPFLIVMFLLIHMDYSGIIQSNPDVVCLHLLDNQTDITVCLVNRVQTWESARINCHQQNQIFLDRRYMTKLLNYLSNNISVMNDLRSVWIDSGKTLEHSLKRKQRCSVLILNSTEQANMSIKTTTRRESEASRTHTQHSGVRIQVVSCLKRHASVCISRSHYIKRVKRALNRNPNHDPTEVEENEGEEETENLSSHISQAHFQPHQQSVPHQAHTHVKQQPVVENKSLHHISHSGSPTITKQSQSNKSALSDLERSHQMNGFTHPILEQFQKHLQKKQLFYSYAIPPQTHNNYNYNSHYQRHKRETHQESQNDGYISLSSSVNDSKMTSMGNDVESLATERFKNDEEISGSSNDKTSIVAMTDMENVSESTGEHEKTQEGTNWKTDVKEDDHDYNVHKWKSPMKTEVTSKGLKKYNQVVPSSSMTSDLTSLKDNGVKSPATMVSPTDGLTGKYSKKILTGSFSDLNRKFSLPMEVFSQDDYDNNNNNGKYHGGKFDNVNWNNNRNNDNGWKRKKHVEKIRKHMVLSIPPIVSEGHLESGTIVQGTEPNNRGRFNVFRNNIPQGNLEPPGMAAYRKLAASLLDDNNHVGSNTLQFHDAHHETIDTHDHLLNYSEDPDSKIHGAILPTNGEDYLASLTHQTIPDVSRNVGNKKENVLSQLDMDFTGNGANEVGAEDHILPTKSLRHSRPQFELIPKSLQNDAEDDARSNEDEFDRNLGVSNSTKTVADAGELNIATPEDDTIEIGHKLALLRNGELSNNETVMNMEDIGENIQISSFNVEKTLHESEEQNEFNFNSGGVLHFDSEHVINRDIIEDEDRNNEAEDKTVPSEFPTNFAENNEESVSNPTNRYSKRKNGEIVEDYDSYGTMEDRVDYSDIIELGKNSVTGIDKDHGDEENTENDGRKDKRNIADDNDGSKSDKIVADKNNRTWLTENSKNLKELNLKKDDESDDIENQDLGENSEVLHINGTNMTDSAADENLKEGNWNMYNARFSSESEPLLRHKQLYLDKDDKDKDDEDKDDDDSLGNLSAPSEKDLSEEVEELNVNVNLDGSFEDIAAAAKHSMMTSMSVDSVIDIADILEKTTQQTKMTVETGNRILTTIDNVLSARSDTLARSQRIAAAPNRIIQSLERFGNNVDLQGKESLVLDKENCALQVWDISTESLPILGFVALSRLNANMSPNPSLLNIFNHTNMADFLTKMDVSIRLPLSIYSKGLQDHNQTKNRLVFSVYRRTSLFEEMNLSGTKKMHKLNSPVISATWNGKEIRNLTDNVITMFNPTEPSMNDINQRCVFWNFSLNNGRGAWSTDGCSYHGRRSGHVVCYCDHLTNFAVLMDFYGDAHLQKTDHILSIITIFGLSMSCTGLIITIFTFIFFKKFREGNAQRALLQIAIAQLVSCLLFLIGIERTENPIICAGIAASLQYFLLATFLWTLMEAILQYLAFVKVFNAHITHFLLKASFVAWGLPLIPVTAVLAVDYRLYLGYTKYCWMTSEVFYFGFALPIGLILIFNLVVFGMILNSITRKKTLRSSQSSHRRAMINLQAGFTSFITLGISWIFGFLAIAEAKTVFQFIFTILNTMQGFIIFLMFIIRKQQVRDWWKKLVLQSFKSFSTHPSASTISSESLNTAQSQDCTSTEGKSFLKR